RVLSASAADGSTITVPTIPAHDPPMSYAWTLQKYVNVPAVGKVCEKVGPGKIGITGGGPGGLKLGLESHAGEPPETGPVIVCGSVGVASIHSTIVPCTRVRSSGAKACTAYTESPHPPVQVRVTVETPAGTARWLVI